MKEIERWMAFLKTVKIFINNEDIVDIFGEPDMHFDIIDSSMRARLYKHDFFDKLSLSVVIDYLNDVEEGGAIS